MIRAATFAGKRVAVFGLGGSGQATVASLLAGGAEVAAWDDGEKARAAAAAAGAPLVDLRQADWTQFAALVLAPGVPLTHPEPHWTVVAANAAGVEVIGDIEIFCRERRASAPDVPFVAITGTNGKSTTTALVAHILRKAGLDAQMGGNIGVPVLALKALASAPTQSADPGPDAQWASEGPSVYIIEMSSFQIDLTPSLDPTIGVLLNISADHLDRHGPADDAELAMRNYAAIKERLVASADTVVIGIDGSECEEIYNRRPNNRNWEAISVLGDVGDWQAKEGRLYDSRSASPYAREFANLNGISTLRGVHNAQNALAAAVTFILLEQRTTALLSYPASQAGELLQAALATYPGLPHRMEEVGRAGKVVFINDSKATNADSTEKALASWPRDIYWILGGKPKEGGIRPLQAYFPRIAKAYLIGAAADDFAATLDGEVDYERSGTLDRAIASAAADAAADAAHSTGMEPVVLLSPACASYDQFRSFEHRGDSFRDLVRAMPGITTVGAS